MTQRVLNIYTSVPVGAGFRFLEPGEPWTRELGDAITAPGAWVELDAASAGVGDEGVQQERLDAPVVDAGDVEVEAGVSEAHGGSGDDIEDDEPGDDEAFDAESVARYKGMKKSELQAALDERGLDTDGKVAELLARLAADDAAAQ